MKIRQLKKQYLFIIIGVLLVGVISTIIQIATAGVTGPHVPGHTWAQLDKPADCSTGQYVRGADDSGWLCSTPSGGSLTQTYVSCSWTSATTNNCTATCPAGYTRTGCSGSGIASVNMIRYIEYLRATPYGSDSCQCYCKERQDGSMTEYNCSAGECFAYCTKIQ